MNFYKLKNWNAYLDRALQKMLASASGMVGATTMRSELSATVIRADGTREDAGLLSARVVTDAGVSRMATDWLDGSTDISNYNFHDSGTGSTAESVSDTNLVTPAGPTTRATGTKSKPTAPQIRSVATIAYTSTLAIVEHGLFDNATRGTDNLWDRSVFSAINVVSGDSIQFTYTLTITSGG